MEFVVKIEEKVKKYQKNTGATQTWMAQQLGMSRQSFNKLLKSKNPTLESLTKIASLIGCEPDELYELKLNDEEQKIVEDVKDILDKY